MTKLFSELADFLWNGDLIHFALHGPTNRTRKIIFEIIKYGLLLSLVRSAVLHRSTGNADSKKELLNFQYRIF